MDCDVRCLGSSQSGRVLVFLDPKPRSSGWFGFRIQENHKPPGSSILRCVDEERIDGIIDPKDLRGTADPPHREPVLAIGGPDLQTRG